MKRQRFLRTAGLGLALAVSSFGAELQGYLMDKMCAQKFTNAADAAKHDRTCVMSCGGKSGYGVLTSDGKFVPFDKEGNRKAQQALKASDKKDDLKVEVTGDEEGGVFKVKTLKLS